MYVLLKFKSSNCNFSGFTDQRKLNILRNYTKCLKIIFKYGYLVYYAHITPAKIIRFTYCVT